MLCIFKRILYNFVMEKFVVDIKDIDIFASLECGQTFRFKKLNNNLYEVYSLNKYALIEKQGNLFVVSSSDIDYFYKYFALDEDYESIIKELKANPMIRELLPTLNLGIRILKQNPIEMIFSFIISANNNIPRIKGIIDKLCVALGEKIDVDKYAFPSIDVLARQSEEFYKSIGLGYRAPYILNTAKRLSGGFNALDLAYMDTENARVALMSLSGVGPKVADCILLFGYNKYDVFPVDTWIKKVYKDLYKKDNSVEGMRKDFIKDFGKYSGIAQQYLFYNKREEK